MGEKEIMSVLDWCYDKAVEGKLPGERTVEELAGDYLRKNNTKEKAIKSLINYQTALGGANGFVTGLGGLVLLPIAVPSNIVSVIYVQLRMIVAIAYINGYDIYSDQVRTAAYLCLTGSSMTNIVKNVGIKIGEKVAISALKKLPGTILTKINQQIGFRLVTKFGTKGMINLGKMVPIVGGVIGGAIDTGTTKVIGNLAKEFFTEVEYQELENVEYI